MIRPVTVVVPGSGCLACRKERWRIDPSINARSRITRQ
jgi:hypothetical protein